MDLNTLSDNQAIMETYDLNEARLGYLISYLSQTYPEVHKLDEADVIKYNDAKDKVIWVSDIFTHSLNYAREMYIPEDENNIDWDKKIEETDEWLESRKK